jgi:hypothetical protein
MASIINTLFCLLSNNEEEEKKEAENFIQKEKPKKKVSFDDSKNETILIQNLSEFLKQSEPIQRNPHTGKILYRICCSGEISSVIVLYDGSLLEMTRGFQIHFTRLHFPSYMHWMNFIVNN